MSILAKITLKNLLLNKKRTIVTVIGVILSAAMISGVTTFVASFQNMLLQETIANSGDWQVSYPSVQLDKVQSLKSDDELKHVMMTRDMGYVDIEKMGSESRPYLFIKEMDSEALSHFAVKLIDGRLPEKAGEIVLPSSARTGIDYQIGEKITLDIGQLNEMDASPDSDEVQADIEENQLEELTDIVSRTYTIVGVIERPGFEWFGGSWFSAITYLDSEQLQPTDLVNVSLIAEDGVNIFKKEQSLFEALDLPGEAKVEYNYNLLMYMGYSDSVRYYTVLYGVTAFLITLISIGSIALIYNAFSISVSERSRQFGMLSSIGATAKQIRQSVFYEAMFISLMGIPLGIFSGVAGIGITFYWLNSSFRDMMESSDLVLTLVVSTPAIIVAIILSLLTILLSAYLPARRIAKLSAIEAIRQVKDIQLSAKKVKANRFIRKLFGFEGELAVKNMKRSRKRYRSTIFSIFISILLFLAVVGFTNQITQSSGMYYQDADYDVLVSAWYYDGQSDMDPKMIQDIMSLPEVKEASYIKNSSVSAEINPKFLDETYSRYHEEGYGYVDLYGVDDDTFSEFCRQLKLDQAEYFDDQHPKAIVFNQVNYYTDDNHQKRVQGNLFAALPERIEFTTWIGDKETSLFSVEPTMLTTERLLGLDDMRASAISIIPMSVYKELEVHFDMPSEDGRIYMTSDQASELTKAVEAIVQDYGLEENVSVHDVEASMQETRNAVLIISVFTYGFIILITLIGVSNVLNTISTNMSLRRQEFAMLKSVGMTPKSFYRMIRFECLLYGFKSLMYGLPVGLLATFVIHQIFSEGYIYPFLWPWSAMGICIVAVFGIVFLSMMYAMAKIRKETIIDALRSEGRS